MIKINLLPPDLRKKEIMPKIPLSFIAFLVILIIFAIHILLFFLSMYKKVQVAALNKTWETMQPQFKEIDALRKNLEAERSKVKIREYVLKRDFYWTDFLNKINKAVPKGLWLNHLSLSDTGLVIEGSVFSFGTEEVSLVNKFFDELKSDGFFIQYFNKFNLDSVQRRSIKDYEILDFLLTAQINKEKPKVERRN